MRGSVCPKVSRLIWVMKLYCTKAPIFRKAAMNMFTNTFEHGKVLWNSFDQNEGNEIYVKHFHIRTLFFISECMIEARTLKRIWSSFKKMGWQPTHWKNWLNKWLCLSVLNYCQGSRSCADTFHRQEETELFNDCRVVRCLAAQHFSRRHAWCVWPALHITIQPTPSLIWKLFHTCWFSKKEHHRMLACLGIGRFFVGSGFFYMCGIDSSET